MRLYQSNPQEDTRYLLCTRYREFPIYRKLIQRTRQRIGQDVPQVKLTHVKKLPLVIADQSKQHEIADLVKQILSTKKRHPEADVSSLVAGQSRQASAT